MNCKVFLTLCLTLALTCSTVLAVDHDWYKRYGKEQIKTYDSRGNVVYTTPNYHSYAERNEQVSEKVVAIYSRYAPEGTCGVRYILYTPIGHYVGYHRVTQHSPSGFGTSPIYDGGEYSGTPCFNSIQEARHYYYPQWY